MQNAHAASAPDRKLNLGPVEAPVEVWAAAPRHARPATRAAVQGAVGGRLRPPISAGTIHRRLRFCHFVLDEKFHARERVVANV